MKLRQLLKAHFDTNGATPMGRGIIDYILTPKLLQVYSEELNQCNEFSGSRVEIIEEIKGGKPQRVITGHDEEGIPIVEMRLSTVTTNDEPIVTAKLTEKTRFAPVIKLYSISLGPEMFEPSDLFKTEKDTAYITPSIYNPESMEPTKRIVITFSPEMAQDSAIKELRKEIKEREKDEEKPEFKVKIEEDGVKVEESIKTQETEASDLMGSVNKEEITQKVKEKENEYYDKLVELLKECLNNPTQHMLPAKRSILLRLTQDSLIQNDKPVIHTSDTTVTLK